MRPRISPFATSHRLRHTRVDVGDRSYVRRVTRALPIWILVFSTLSQFTAGCEPTDRSTQPPSQTVRSVQVVPESLSLAVGSDTTLRALALNSNRDEIPGLTPVWVSTSPANAIVDAFGRVTGVSPGAASIMANYGGVSASTRVRVYRAAVYRVEVAPAGLTLEVGDSTALTVAIRDANGRSIAGVIGTWTSGDSSVASVTATGLVRGLKAGTAVVICSAEGRAGSATITVQNAAVNSVIVAPSAVSIHVGGSSILTASALDRRGHLLTGRPFSWASGASNIAWVEGNSDTAAVTGLGAGTVAILVACEGKSGSTLATVGSPVNAPCPPEGASVVAADGVVLGTIVNSRFSTSVFSHLRPSNISIYNALGSYGGYLSRLSPFCPTTNTPPSIFQYNTRLGWFSVNPNLTGKIYNPVFGATCLYP